MEKILNALFSMRAMAVAMIVFFVAIGRATFIESAYGIQAAKITVYNALWFEVLLVFLAMNLMANIWRYQMWKREKIALLSFHISFLVIMLGAAITRFTGFEGMMLIREGESSNIIHSADPYLTLFNHEQKLKSAHKMWLSEVTNNNFDIAVDFPGHPVRMEYVDFMSKHIDSLIINDSIKGTALEIVTTDPASGGRKSNFMTPGEALPVGAAYIQFGNDKLPAGINIYEKNGVLMMRTNIPVKYLAMSKMQEARQTGVMPADSSYRFIQPNEEVPFATTTLYEVGGGQFVFKQALHNAKRYKMPSGRKDVGSDYLVVRVSEGKESKVITLEGGMGMIPTPEAFTLNGKEYHLEYGSKEIKTPFLVKCNDFIIERYPGSDMPSSYASDLQVLDKANNYFKKKRVFMNHVMDYNGYRFFQSSYDPDEKGTRLSVNHDYWGTLVTYIGYLLMAVGMVLSLFAPAGRFRDLLSKLSKSRSIRTGTTTLLLVAAFMGSGTAWAQTQQEAEHNHEEHAGHDHEHDHDHEHHDASHTVVAAPGQQPEKKDPIVRYMSEEHSDELASLLVQDFDGRIVPMHTVCDQLLRKLYRANKYKGYNAVQIIVSMHMYPEFWMEEPVIQVPAAVREKYKLKDYASFIELTDVATGAFKWADDYKIALRKKESERGETEKKLIKLVEKQQVFLGLLNWSYMKVIPVKNDPKNTWYDPISFSGLANRDSLALALPLEYLSAVHKASDDGNYRQAMKLLGDLKAYQRETAPSTIVPSETHVKTEISYNKMGIFKNAQNLYGALGFIIIILFIISILSKETDRANKRFRIVRMVFVGMILITFLYHGAGIAMRWYISGHAPWSNGYEAVVFIGWVTMIAGWIFSRFHPIIIGIAALLAYFMLFVSDMNLLDPEITPLQPVLKSYWLMIHVAIITGSYGFLGLSFMIGMINMVLYVIRSSRTSSKVTTSISTLTYVSEMTMTIGLFMLTIGTFLGGVWANESWGRYWGWDPKETWALVSVLVYAVILHLRYIPGLKGKFTFNAVSLWGYSAILFTFFGVNFILVGLHSYAQGDGSVSLPGWVIYAIIFFVLLTVAAAIRNAQHKKAQRTLL